MFLLRKYQSAVGAFLGSESSRAWQTAAIAVLLCMGSLALAMWKMGAPPMNGRPWDCPILLDGAWRILNGQVPHRDFFSPIGPLPFYLTAIGMKLGAPGVTSITHGTVLLMVMLSALGFVLLRRRTTAFYAFLFSGFLGLLVVTPRPLGDPYDYIDYAMLYNREGEAFLFLLGLLCFLPGRSDCLGWRENVEAGLAGLLVAILWCVKMNYFCIALGFIGFAVLFRFVTVRFGLVSAGSILVSCALFHLVSGVGLEAMFGDFKITSKAQDFPFRAKVLLTQTAKFIVLLPFLLVPAWECAAGLRETGFSRLQIWRTWLLPLFLFTCALLLVSSNTQIGDLPLLALSAFYGAEMIRRQTPVDRPPAIFGTFRNVAALGLVAVFLAPITGLDLKALRNVAFAAFSKVPQPTRHSLQQP